jgi:CRP/FNR family transcriptional regulator, cyclic AMP receptor protein
VIEDGFAREVLAGCSLFSAVDASALEACLAAVRTRRFRRDEIVFHQGDPGDALHVIARGSVKIVLPSPDAAEPAILATLGPGEFFGEVALLDRQPHSASVIALAPTQTLALARADFERLFETQPGLRWALLTSLAGEIRRLTWHVESLHFLDLRERLARRIAGLVALAPGSRPDGGEVRLDWPYTQSEVAGMIGGSRESVNRLLAELVAQGVIRFERDVLVVPDPARLTAGDASPARTAHPRPPRPRARAARA